ncbi:DUF2798 domain-containing protein [Chachezhania sediminis]|uniref:DUF2798 domain-containing protein n=1 Tax=Chachezhania sediminis TaxID=2599291 RepID=UPI00131EB309|nr:DUF2798 domain-containing protein [Chachezhania sediminis]
MTLETRRAVLSGLMMSCAMSLFFSGFFTFLALGPTQVWLMAWARGFCIGWPLGFALASCLARPFDSLAARLSGKD